MPQNIIDQNLYHVIRISFEMLEIAERGDNFRMDSRCGAVFGKLRDTAYQVRRLAEEELSRHKDFKNAAGNG